MTSPMVQQSSTPSSVRTAIFTGYTALIGRLRTATDLQSLGPALAKIAGDLSDQGEQPEATRQAAADAMLALAELSGSHGRGGHPSNASTQDSEKAGDKAREWRTALTGPLDRACAEERAFSVKQTLLKAKARTALDTSEHTPL